MRILLTFLCISLFVGCQDGDTNEPEVAEVRIQELNDPKTLEVSGDLLLGLPLRLRFDPVTSHMFIQDLANYAVIELDENGTEVRRFGREGEGPGEVRTLSNFFLSKDHLFLLDESSFFIHKYKRDGEYLSSLDYGELRIEPKSRFKIGGSMPPPPPPSLDNFNRPFVTRSEMVLLPAESNGEYLYQAFNWQGEMIAGIGEVPEGFSYIIDEEEVIEAIKNRKVSARDAALAFPVSDINDPDETYLVYSGISKIAKYSLSGKKIWERSISATPEVDSLMIDLSTMLEEYPKQRFTSMPLKKYMSGRSTPDGNLYLTTYSNSENPYIQNRPIWIHQFGPQGKLVGRYKLISDTEMLHYPAIDIRSRRIIVPSFRESDLRMYAF